MAKEKKVDYYYGAYVISYDKDPQMIALCSREELDDILTFLYDYAHDCPWQGIKKRAVAGFYQ